MRKEPGLPPSPRFPVRPVPEQRGLCVLPVRTGVCLSSHPVPFRDPFSSLHYSLITACRFLRLNFPFKSLCGFCASLGSKLTEDCAGTVQMESGGRWVPSGSCAVLSSSPRGGERLGTTTHCGPQRWTVRTVAAGFDG